MSYSPPRNNTRDVYTMGDKRRQKVLDMGRSKSFGQVNVPDLKCLRKFKSGRNHITDYPLCKTQNHVFCLSLFKLSRNPISRLCVVYYSVRVIEMDK